MRPSSQQRGGFFGLSRENQRAFLDDPARHSRMFAVKSANARLLPKEATSIVEGGGWREGRYGYDAHIPDEALRTAADMGAMPTALRGHAAL
jgi:hypothetical protein